MQAARDLLRTPVVSSTESAMLMACTLGRRFGCVTFDDDTAVLIERNIRAYGLEHRALQVLDAVASGAHMAGMVARRTGCRASARRSSAAIRECPAR